MIVRASRAEELERINRIVHDCWFRVDEVVGPCSGTVEVPLEVTLPDPPRAGDRATASSHKATLRVQGVQAMDLRDSQGINSYDINRLEFDPRRAVLVVKANIPMKWEMSVGQWVAELLVSEG